MCLMSLVSIKFRIVSKFELRIHIKSLFLSFIFLLTIYRSAIENSIRLNLREVFYILLTCHNGRPGIITVLCFIFIQEINQIESILLYNYFHADILQLSTKSLAAIFIPRVSRWNFQSTLNGWTITMKYLVFVVSIEFYAC